MFEFEEIVNRVNQDDLAKAEKRLKQEREARRVLRLQDTAKQNYTASELLAKLAGVESEDEMPQLSLNTEAKHERPKPIEGFPPPPTAPIESSK